MWIEVSGLGGRESMAGGTVLGVRRPEKLSFWALAPPKGRRIYLPTYLPTYLTYKNTDFMVLHVHVYLRQYRTQQRRKAL